MTSSHRVRNIVTHEEDIEKIAVRVMKHAFKHAPDEIIAGDVTSLDLVRLAAPNVLTCPSCGSTAWVNIDCDVCQMCSKL